MFCKQLTRQSGEAPAAPTLRVARLLCLRGGALGLPLVVPNGKEQGLAFLRQGLYHGEYMHGIPRIKIPKSWIEKFCKAHHIVKMALFGSVLTDHFSDTSDVDVLVEFEPEHIPGLFGIVGMKEELSKHLGREVDLRTPEDISKLFRQEVIQQSYLLYGKEGFKPA
jgi:hypothetical protein